MTGQELPLRLNYSLMVAETDDGLALHVADAEPFTVRGDYALLLAVLGAVNAARNESEIAAVLADAYTEERVREVLSFARAHNLLKSVALTDRIVAESLGKWDRQIRNFTNLSGIDDDAAVDLHRRLVNAHVLIVGVGGVGGYVASASAMIGIGRISIVDFDSVELSNTSRQVLYTEADIGRRKLDVAVSELTRRAPSASIHAVDCEITDDQSMVEVVETAKSLNGAIDLLVLCADQPRGEITYIVDRASQSASVPFLVCSPHDFSHASVGPLVIPGITKSYSDAFPSTRIRTDNVLVQAVNAQFIANIMEPYNGIAAKMAMIEIVKFITGYARPFVQDRVVNLDTADWSVTVHEID